MWQDLRYGLRMLSRWPSFTAIAVLTLALGLGASTAIFSVADAVLLRPLPVRNPERLALFRWASGPHLMGDGFWPGVNIDPVTGASTSASFSYLSFEQFRAQGNTLADIFAFTSMFRMSGRDDDVDSPSGQIVSGNYFTGLGIPAILGRTLTPDDDKETATPVAAISYRYWEREFGRDPATVGKTLNLGGTAFIIVGITPAGFTGTQEIGDAPDFSIPLAMADQISTIGPKFTDTMKKETWLWPLMIMGRLKPEVSFDQVRAGLQDTLYATALEGWNADPWSKSAQASLDTPRLEVLAGNQGLNQSRRAWSKTVMMMMGIVGLLLLIVCSNLANLLLARAATRRKEIAVRLALGASRWRLLRQLLTESVLLASIGAALGLLFALWGKDLLWIWINRLTPSFVIEPQLDLRVLGFTAAVTLLTGIFVGLAPALRATRVEINQVMKDSARTASSLRSFVSRGLLVAQVALSLVLLVSAGLFVRTLRNLQTADVGFNTANLLLFSAQPQWNKHKRAQIANLYAQVSERIQAVPGVVAVTNSQKPLLTRDLAMPFIWVPGHIRQAGEDPTVYVQYIWPNFFETMQMPLLLGRNLTSRDNENYARGGPYVTIVNETLARRYFSTADPTGQRIGITKDATIPAASEKNQIEIVGVVRDAKYTSVRQDVPPTIFLPFEPNPVTFAVRTAGDPSSLIAAIREAVARVDADLRLADFRTQSAQAALTFARERHFAFLSSLFGILALLLVCIGLHGLLSYNVANRTQEIGIRLALGAQNADVMRLVMRETLWLVCSGIAIGMGAALALTRLMASMLYGLTANDPASILCAILLMLVVAVLASYLPARRASRVDPMVALRYE